MGYGHYLIRLAARNLLVASLTIRSEYGVSRLYDTLDGCKRDRLNKRYCSKRVLVQRAGFERLMVKMAGLIVLSPTSRSQEQMCMSKRMSIMQIHDAG